jgi:ADP-ribose pyrophosphatase YjhB (NUDIX family)
MAKPDAKAIDVEMNFCRRCGTPLTHKRGVMYVCEKGHPLFVNASPATAVLLLNGKNELLLIERAIEPKKGWLDAPGGFCDGAEDPLTGAARELQEEVGLTPEDYSPLEFILADIDMYEYEGERLPVFDLVYTARLTTDRPPVAGDDAALVRFIPIAEVALDDIAFPSVRRGVARLQKQLG